MLEAMTELRKMIEHHPPGSRAHVSATKVLAALERHASIEAPFLDIRPLQLDNSDTTLVCGGVTVGALTIRTEQDEVLPGLLFRFMKADGSGPTQPIMFATNERLAGFTELVASAVTRAREVAGV